MTPTPPPGIERVLERLGLTIEPPLVRRRIELALEFFHDHRIKEDFLAGIDFAHEVSRDPLAPGRHLIAYRNGPIAGATSWNPFGLFYTDVGTSAYHVGIKPDGRLYARFLVVKAGPALKSRAAGIAVTSSKPSGSPRYLAGGGGWQYIVPGASAVLKKV